MSGTVLVTGGTGLVGPGVVRALLHDGWSVRVLMRDPKRVPDGCEAAPGDMTDRASLDRACHGVRFVVHLAARKNDEPDSIAVNVDGAHMLGAAAKKAGAAGIVHLSTQSVRLARRGLYGQSKLDAERALDACGIPVAHLRASVVYGDEPDGIVGSILGFAKLPFIPVIGDGRPRFRPIHRDDLGAIIAALLTRDSFGGTENVGGSEEYTFDALVRAILRARGLRRPLVHVPIAVALPMARVLSFLLPRSPITVSNVLGAAEDVPFDPTSFLAACCVRPRSFKAHLTHLQIPGTFTLRDEARMLLTYIGFACRLPPPSDTVIARYIGALETHGVSVCPSFPRRMGTYRLLAHDWATRLRNPAGTLQKKLLIAAAIREADPGGAGLLPPQQSAASVLLAAVRTCCACLAVLPLCIFFLVIDGRR